MSLPSRATFYKFGIKLPVFNLFVNCGWFDDESAVFESYKESIIKLKYSVKDFDFVVLYSRLYFVSDLKELETYYTQDDDSSLIVNDIGDLNMSIYNNLSEPVELDKIIDSMEDQQSKDFVRNRIKFIQEKFM